MARQPWPTPKAATATEAPAHSHRRPAYEACSTGIGTADIQCRRTPHRCAARRMACELRHHPRRLGSDSESSTSAPDRLSTAATPSHRPTRRRLPVPAATGPRPGPTHTTANTKRRRPDRRTQPRSALPFHHHQVHEGGRIQWSSQHLLLFVRTLIAPRMLLQVSAIGGSCGAGR